MSGRFRILAGIHVFLGGPSAFFSSLLKEQKFSNLYKSSLAGVAVAPRGSSLAWSCRRENEGKKKEEKKKITGRVCECPSRLSRFLEERTKTTRAQNRETEFHIAYLAPIVA